MYSCSKCGLAVIVYDENGKVLEKPIKACNCVAPITASMSAVAHGSGALLGGKPKPIKVITLEDDDREDRERRALGND